MFPEGGPARLLDVEEHHHVRLAGEVEGEVLLHHLLETDHVLRLSEVQIVRAGLQGRSLRTGLDLSVEVEYEAETEEDQQQDRQTSPTTSTTRQLEHFVNYPGPH